jgi:hypothetical protein
MMTNEFLDAHLSRCESPIEKGFLSAIVRLGNSIFIESSQELSIELNWGDWNRFLQIPAKQDFQIWYRDVLFIWSQAQINNYRADFLVGLVSYAIEGTDQLHEVLIRRPLVVIECDGHDFHERTKQQAKNDKSRDRYMQSLGFRVLRFTGSEIHADALKCAQEAMEFIVSLPGADK